MHSVSLCVFDPRSVSFTIPTTVTTTITTTRQSGKHTDNKALWEWMAVEVMQHNTHSVWSDVWSFAVLLWEITAFGAPPFPGMTHAEVRMHITLCASDCVCGFGLRNSSELVVRSPIWLPRAIVSTNQKAVTMRCMSLTITFGDGTININTHTHTHTHTGIVSCWSVGTRSHSNGLHLNDWPNALTTSTSHLMPSHAHRENEAAAHAKSSLRHCCQSHSDRHHHCSQHPNRSLL